MMTDPFSDILGALSLSGRWRVENLQQDCPLKHGVFRVWVLLDPRHSTAIPGFCTPISAEVNASRSSLNISSIFSNLIVEANLTAGEWQASVHVQRVTLLTVETRYPLPLRLTRRFRSRKKTRANLRFRFFRFEGLGTSRG